MGVLGKFAFWKKEEIEPGVLEGSLPADEQMPGIGSFDMPPMPSMPKPAQPLLHPDFQSSPMAYPAQAPYPQPIDKDLQLISSKLDTIKAQLDNLNDRIARLEKIAEGETHARW